MSVSVENQQLTLDHVLMKDPHFFKIQELLRKLSQSDVLRNMKGNCVSACDTMQHLLLQVGIDSVIVECQLVITRDGTNQANDLLFIGYDDRNYIGEVDTHVILITKSKVPLIIDLSLGHVLPADHSYVIERLNDTNKELGIYTIGNLTLSYTNKPNIRLHNVHQKNLLTKFLEDERRDKKISFIERLAYWALVLTGVNVVLNSIILLHKLFLG
jgi:hypothetical protein